MEIKEILFLLGILIVTTFGYIKITTPTRQPKIFDLTVISFAEEFCLAKNGDTLIFNHKTNEIYFNNNPPLKDGEELFIVNK